MATTKATKSQIIRFYCPIDHSGNHHVSLSQPGWYQCSGCGHHYSDEHIRDSFARKRTQHVPAPGYGQGLRSQACCGRWASWGTGDHEQIRRLASGAITSGDTAGWCKRCLAAWRKSQGL